MNERKKAWLIRILIGGVLGTGVGVLFSLGDGIWTAYHWYGIFLAAAFGAYAPGAFPRFHIDFTFRDGEVLSLAGLAVRVIATPGHTAGGASFLIGDRLYSGDTLFAGDIGRSDLPTGSGAQLVASVKKLYALEGDYTVCPGHGEDTTLEYERRHNGWVRC